MNKNFEYKIILMKYYKTFMFGTVLHLTSPPSPSLHNPLPPILSSPFAFSLSLYSNKNSFLHLCTFVMGSIKKWEQMLHGIKSGSNLVVIISNWGLTGREEFFGIWRWWSWGCRCCVSRLWTFLPYSVFNTCVSTSAPLSLAVGLVICSVFLKNWAVWIVNWKVLPVLGDFNLEPDDLGYRLIVDNANLIDAWLARPVGLSILMTNCFQVVFGLSFWRGKRMLWTRESDIIHICWM